MPDEAETRSSEADQSEPEPPAETGANPSTNKTGETKTRSGRVSKPPARLYAKVNVTD